MNVTVYTAGVLVGLVVLVFIEGIIVIVNYYCQKARKRRCRRRRLRRYYKQ